MPANVCIDAIKAAAGRDLTDDEIDEIVSRVQAHQKRLKAAGTVDRMDRRLADMARDDAERTRRAALASGAISCLARPTASTAAPSPRRSAPTAGFVSDLITMCQEAREGEFSTASALNTVLSTTPFANLFYTRPVLDYLVLDAMREAVSPGYLRRQAERREKDYGQERMWPQGG